MRQAVTKKTPDPQLKQAPADSLPTEHTLFDPIALSRVMMDVSQKSQPILKEFLSRQGTGAFREADLDPFNLSPAYIRMFNQLWSNPQKLAEMQIGLWQDWSRLWQESAKKFIGQTAEPVAEPAPGDRRFKSATWQDSAIFDFIKQSYLLTSRWAERMVADTEGIDEETRKKLDFHTKQFVNALAPTNFLMTNPDVLRETLESNGENLIRGLKNLLEDMERGHGELRISTTDYKAFEVGRNLAMTPGKVIYENELMQLIQYKATTDKVFKRPLLIIPPWINKYYILDLKPENSLIRWLVEQGHTVFTISWVNPDKKLAQKRFEDYLQEGVIEALHQIEQVTGEPDCNAAGYCLGGTLLATTLAWLAAHKKSGRIAAATFLTTLIDFEHAGDLKLFIDDHQLEMLDREISDKGYLEADTLRRTFSLLRSNDLIWSFVVNNYLMGREPFPFDLLYWNDDATNMPAAMHKFYLRKFYRENLLIQPGGVTMQGTPINISKIKTPSYFLSTREDHIAPWKATYAATQLFQGPVQFTLAASGHVAGVVNPPDKNKYCYWTAPKNPENPDDWLAQTQQDDGSWWPHWQKWITAYTGELVPRRTIGGGKLKPIEDAPGRYVRQKAD